MRKASGFVAVGLLMGALGGGGILAGAGVLAGGGAPTPTQPGIVVVPSGSVEPAATLAPPTPAPSVGPEIPPAARAAIGQVGTLNVRLLETAGDLRTHLEAPSLDASAVARTLRSMNSNAAFGLDVSRRLATWDTAAALAGELDALYGEVRAIAREGLAASVRNTTAYRTAATSMLTLLAGMGPIDAEARSVARGAGVDLPPLDLEGLDQIDGGSTVPNVSPAP
jgi:hypothetical protein